MWRKSSTVREGRNVIEMNLEELHKNGLFFTVDSFELRGERTSWQEVVNGESRKGLYYR